MYFTNTPSLNSMEAIMQRPPGGNQRGGGRIRRAYQFNKADCDCRLCLYHRKKKGCSMEICPVLDARLTCGAASFYEAIHAAFADARHTPFQRRLSHLYSDEGVGITLTSSAGGFGGKTGLYDVALPIKVDTKSGFQLAHPGDSIDLAYPTMNTRRGRVGEKIAHTVTPGNTQGYFFIDMNAGAKLTETARCITARQDSGISKHKGEHSAVFIEDEPRAVVTPDKKTIRQQGRWIKEPNEPMFTLTVQDRHGILRYGRVRKLTPRECWRLQGFADEQFDKAAATGLKDGRLYKMAGNAVSVPVVSAVGAVIKRIYQEQIQKG